MRRKFIHKTWQPEGKKHSNNNAKRQDLFQRCLLNHKKIETQHFRTRKELTGLSDSTASFAYQES